MQHQGKVKILLIQLYNAGMAEPIYPLGLAYLATSLSAYDVCIFDQDLCEENPFLETEKVLADFHPDIVGISLRNFHLYSPGTHQILNCNDKIGSTIRAIKGVDSNAVIVAGGTGFSLFPSYIMKTFPEIDFGIHLEAEESFKQFLTNIDSPDTVNGIFFRNGNDIIFTGTPELPRFELSLEPRRDLVDPKRYIWDDAVGIQTKRGCILNCIYCPYPFLSGRSLRLRPPQKVVDEIENMVQNFSIKNFMFADNVFNVPSSHAEEICHEIINRGLQVQWSAWFNERFMDKDFIDLAIAAGCRKFELSPDGFNDNSLKWLNKNIKTKHIIRTYRSLRRKKNIKIAYNFLVSIPGENIFSFLRFGLFLFSMKLFLRERLEQITLSKLVILPGSPIEKRALNEGYITPETSLSELVFYETGIFSWLKGLKPVHSLLKMIKDIIQTK